MPAIKTGSSRRPGGNFNTPIDSDPAYIFEILNAEKTLSSRKGSPRVTFRFKVVGGGPMEEDGEGSMKPKFLGRSIFEDAYLTDDALWKFEAIAECSGIAKGTEIDPDDPVVLLNSFKGRRIRAAVIDDNWTNNVTGFASLDVAQPEDAQGDDDGNEGAADPN
jgi:hypothetical protein